MPSKKTVMKSYLTPEEYEQIIESADRAGLSLSSFAKRVCLGQPVPSLERQRARLELLRINADLGRLGGLFKLCLSDNGANTSWTQRKIDHDCRFATLKYWATAA